VRGNMKLSEKSRVIKVDFGKFLKESRLESDRSVFDNGYILAVNPQTVWCWEQGNSFPGSIVRIKKLALMYSDTPYFLKDIIERNGIKPSRSEWKDFEKEVYSGGGGLVSGIRPEYVSKDARDLEYKKAFGKYMMRERYNRGITVAAMARALKVNYHTYCAWENGSAWPQEVMVLAMLDKLYSNTFDVLFGLCDENGIHLSMTEKKDVLKRMRMFDGTHRCEPGKGRFRKLK